MVLHLRVSETFPLHSSVDYIESAYLTTSKDIWGLTNGTLYPNNLFLVYTYWRMNKVIASTSHFSVP